MNPLSPFTYYRRHKRRVLLLTALMALAGLNYIFVTQRQAEFGVVFVVSTGAIAWMLSRFDPVAVIEGK